jgi:hypothetical protein
MEGAHEKNQPIYTSSWDLFVQSLSAPCARKFFGTVPLWRIDDRLQRLSRSQFDRRLHFAFRTRRQSQ